MERWSGKTVVVTGASAGIGANICVTLANAGLTVVGLARRPALVDALNSQVKGKCRIHSRQCDLTKLSEVVESFNWVEETFGGTDVLVNNAGFCLNGHITDVGDDKRSDDEILTTIDLNVKALVMCTRQAVSSMKKRAFNGHIININSVLGHVVPFSPYNVYTASKHAVTAFTTSLRYELAEFDSKIKVTSLSPGLVDTDMGKPTMDKWNLKSLNPQDVADALVYVLSTPPNVNITELIIDAVYKNE